MDRAPTSVGSHSRGDAILRAEHLSREIHNKVLVRDVTFSLRAGEVLGVIGPSGSGKSSLLRLLNRLDEPTSGTVYLEGTDYREMIPRDLRRRVGMVTQRPFLFKGTVATNLEFGPKQAGTALSRDAVEELLSQVGLSGYADRNVSNLSGGEAQRVSLARTLANSPEILLLDEPTSALDDASKSGIEALFATVVRERNLSCVLVTHDTQQAARLAQNIIEIEAGGVVRSRSGAGQLNA